MNSPAPTETSDRSIRRLLSEAAKGGGVSARLALVFPLIGGGLLLAQAYVLAHILHEAIIGSAPVSNLLMPAAGLAALADSETVTRLAPLSLTPLPLTGQALMARVRTEGPFWAEIIRSANIRLEN